jgi:hypothetical protein
MAAYEVPSSQGAEFITPPVSWGDEIRAFFHDTDGHLLEITEMRPAELRSGCNVFDRLDSIESSRYPAA